MGKKEVDLESLRAEARQTARDLRGKTIAISVDEINYVHNLLVLLSKSPDQKITIGVGDTDGPPRPPKDEPDPDDEPDP